MGWFGGRNTKSWSLEIWNFIETSSPQQLGISVQKVLKDRDANKKLSVIFPPNLSVSDVMKGADAESRRERKFLM